MVKYEERLYKVGKLLDTLAPHLHLLDEGEWPFELCDLHWKREKMALNSSKGQTKAYDRLNFQIKDDRFTLSDMFDKVLIIRLHNHVDSSLPNVIHVNKQRLNLKGGVFFSLIDSTRDSYYFVENPEETRHYLAFFVDGTNLATFTLG